MKRPIFDFFKTNGWRQDSAFPDCGSRLDNFEVTASYHPGSVGYFQGERRKARALHFDVIDTPPTRRVALMIGGRHS